MPKQLPLHPNLENLKNQAKAQLRAQRLTSPTFLLADAQYLIAREYGFESWSKLKAHVQAQSKTQIEASVNALRDAAGRGDCHALKAILNVAPNLINEVGGSGMRTALHEAVGARSAAAVKLLLENGADPNIRCEGDNAMPLHFACEKQNFEIVRLLIEAGSDPIGEGDYHELGVIGWATAWEYVHSNKTLVDYLLQHGSVHNIWSAVAMGDTDAIQRLAAQSPALLDQRMDLANRRRRPLHLAVIKKQRASLLTLLDLGANIESIDEARFSALDEAAVRGETEFAQLLLERGAKLRLPAAFALQRSVEMKALLRKDPTALKPGNRWGNLIVRAAERGNAAMVEALIHAGADVNTRDDPKTAVDSTSGFTPLHAAAFQGRTSTVAVLLRHGANVRIREERWHGSPGGWAYYAGHKEAHDLIVQADIDIMEAIANGLVEKVRANLEHDPEALNRPFQQYPIFPLDCEGWYTPFVLAVSQGQLEVVRFLIEQGADKTVVSPDGQTLAALAQKNGHGEVAALLQM